MIVIRVLVQEIIISGISVITPQRGLDDSRKVYLYDSFINVIKRLNEKKFLVIAGDFIVHIGSSPKGYEDQRGGSCYEVWNNEEEKTLEFCPAMVMVVGSTLFTNRESQKVWSGF